MKGGPDISVLVPVFNEVESLGELSQEIEAACRAGGYSFEVLFVDDGSSDGSWEEIERLHSEDERFRGIRFRRNYGKSAAIAVGFEEVRGTYVVTMDADLQDDPAEIPGLIAYLEDGYDLVSGWKKTRKDPFIKTVTSRFFNFTTRVVSGIPLHDFNCGLKAYQGTVVRRLKVYGEMHRYLPVLAKWEGFTHIAEKPVNHRRRKYGYTKFGLERFIRGFLDLISVVFLTRFAIRPMHFFRDVGHAVVSRWIRYQSLPDYRMAGRPADWTSTTAFSRYAAHHSRGSTFLNRPARRDDHPSSHGEQREIRDSGASNPVETEGRAGRYRICSVTLSESSLHKWRPDPYFESRSIRT